MRAFDSVAKKLAIAMVVLFEIGWIVYVGGIGSYLHQRNRGRTISDPGEALNSLIFGSQSTSAPETRLRDPVLFPHYFTLVGGQFVALLFLLHAALPSSTVSYIIGALSSVVNVFFFVSVGYMANWSASVVRYLEIAISEFGAESPNSFRFSPGTDPSELRRYNIELHAVRCILAGIVLMAISWGLIQLLFFFYEYKKHSAPQLNRSLWCVIREFVVDLPTSTSQLKATPGEIIRLCVIPLLVLSAVGWCVCVAGLYKSSGSDNGIVAVYSLFATRTSFNVPYEFGTWATFFIAPILYLAALLHAGCSGGASTMSGIFAAIMNTLFVLNVGYKLVDVSITKYKYSKFGLDPLTLSIFSNDFNIDASSDAALRSEAEQTANYINNLILGGGIVCLFFWMIVYTAWNFYGITGSRDHARLQPNGGNLQPQPAHQSGHGDTASFVPEQQLPPPYDKYLESEMQPVN